MRLIMLIALGLAFFQQITGINAIFYYLPTIFAQAGGGVSDAFRQAVIVGLVNVGDDVRCDLAHRSPRAQAAARDRRRRHGAVAADDRWAFSQASYRLDERAAGDGAIEWRAGRADRRAASVGRGMVRVRSRAAWQRSKAGMARRGSSRTVRRWSALR